jgi:long-chain fatty acid transport protein
MTQKIGVFAVAALLAGTSVASAGGFAIREQSTVGQGTSFAGVAAGTGSLSSVFWNPAVSSEYNEFGFISENNAALILPYAEAEASGTSSGNIGQMAIVPAGYFSYGLTDAITITSSVNAPFGLTTNTNNTWAGAIYGDKSAVKTYNWNPAMSYKVNDMLSFGLGAQVEYMSVELTSRSGGNKIFEAEGSDFGFGFTAGVLFEPTETTDIGIGFRSAVKHKLKGEGFLGAPVDTDISAKFTAPETVTVGIRQQVSEQFAVMGGVEWANWSRFKSFEVPELGVDEAYNWKDSWFVSLGGEYAYSDALTLRSGVAYEKSPVPDETRGVRVPDNDRLWLSVGATYKFAPGWTGNFAYSHIMMKDGEVDLSSLGALNTEFDQHINIVSIGLTRDW